MKSKSKPNLSDKISAALTAAPRPDVEDDVVFSTRPQILTRDQLGSSENEVDISEFRRRNSQLLSDINDKYKGEVVSKRDLQLKLESDDSDQENIERLRLESDSEEVSDGENIVSSSTESFGKNYNEEANDTEESDSCLASSKKSDSDQSEDSESDEGSEDGSDNDSEVYDISQMQKPQIETFQHMTKQNVSEELKKGECVRSQLLIWEGLLEMRIHLQRCVNTANHMPAPDVHRDIRRRGGREFQSLSCKTRSNVSKVLDKFLILQNILLKQFPETKAISESSAINKPIHVKPESDEEIPSDDEEIPSDEEVPSGDEELSNDIEARTGERSKFQETAKKPPAKRRKLADYENDISQTHNSFKTFRNAVIQKWNDKTYTTTSTAHKNAPTNSVLSQIDYILSDRSKLIRRTQLKRSEYDIVGYKKPTMKRDNIEEVEISHAVRDRKEDDEYIPEIFDDSDFYHQILRELIECKSADISDPVQLSRQWIALQQMRSKMKRKVDTKATKGRRIKYVVHNKLINFMAPDDTSSWTDETKNELYSSLFGKMFETNATNSQQNGFILTTEKVLKG